MKTDTTDFDLILNTFLNATNQKQNTIAAIEHNILNRLDKKDIFADLGFGNGIITNSIGKHFKKTIAVDNDLGLISTFRKENRLQNLELVPGDISTYCLHEKPDLILFSYVFGYLNAEKEDAGYKLTVFDRFFQSLDNNGIIALVNSTYTSLNYKKLFDFMELPLFDNLKSFEELLFKKYNFNEVFFPVAVRCTSMEELILAFRLITYDIGEVNLRQLDKYREFGATYYSNGVYTFEYEARLIYTQNR